MKPLVTFPERVYEYGGFYDQELAAEDCFRLEELAPDAVSFIADVYGHSYRPDGSYAVLGADDAFKGHVISRYESVRTQYPVAPRSISVSINDCFISNSVIYRPAYEGLDVIHESYRSIDRPWTPSLDFSNPSPPVTRHYDGHDEAVVFLGSVGSKNYGHWLVDDLARAKAVLSFGTRSVVLIASYGEKIDAARVDSLHLALNSSNAYRVELIEPDETIQVNRLTYVTPVSFHPFVKNKQAIDFVRALAPRKAEAGGRLFVTRSRERYRKLLNSAEIEGILQSAGFIVVDPETMTFEEQVRTFSAADIVVGIMCAAMTNTIFCSERTKVVYLAPSEWDEPFYWDLAMTLEHDYTVIYGPRARLLHEPFYDDFSINADLVRDSVAALTSR